MSQELKEWMGVMEYIRSFPDTNGDGISEIPEKYRGKQGRIVVEASWNPFNLLKRGTYITWISLLIFLIILTIIVFIVWGAVRIVRKFRYKI